MKIRNRQKKTDVHTVENGEAHAALLGDPIYYHYCRSGKFSGETPGRGGFGEAGKTTGTG